MHRRMCMSAGWVVLPGTCPYRRDKYESHVKEYWIDVRTTGEMRRTMSELTVRKFEVVASSGDLPLPKLGDGPLPDLPGTDQRPRMGVEDVTDAASNDEPQPNRRQPRSTAQAVREAEVQSAAARKAEDAKHAASEEILEAPVTTVKIWGT